MKKFKPIAKGKPITADWLNQSIGGCVRSVRASSGIKLHRSKGGDVSLVADLDYLRPRIRSSGTNRVNAVLTECVAFSANPNRWKYAWEQVTLDGDDNTLTVSGGQTGTTSSGYAINELEINNPSSDGVMGIGIDTSDTEATVTLYPVGIYNRAGGTLTYQPLVEIRFVPVDTGGTRAVFSGINFATVECA